jgi:hypothetical protein
MDRAGQRALAGVREVLQLKLIITSIKLNDQPLPLDKPIEIEGTEIVPENLIRSRIMLSTSNSFNASAQVEWYEYEEDEEKDVNFYQARTRV